MNIFNNLKHFNINEKWGNPNKINPLLLIILDELRQRIGKKFIIHCAYEQDGHSENSQHYKGNAVDFHIANCQFSIACGLMFEALHSIKIGEKYLSDVCGIGIYPDWNNKGFHLDVRGYPASWGRVSGEYISLEEALKYV